MKVIITIALLLPTLFAAPADKLPQLADEGRIVGGKPTSIQAHPYIVSLQFASGAHTCGGAILNANQIITAAHCVTSVTTRFIRAGSTFFNTGGQLIQVASSVIHPRFNRQNLDFDIAILNLVSPLQFNENCQPIKWGRLHSMPRPGDMVNVTGWGSTREGGPIVTDLQLVQVPIVSNEECARAYQSAGFPVTDSMLCAGFPEGGRDACQGDSGGPLTYEDGLFGTVSWGLGCARPGFYGVYGNVPFMADWIDSQTQAFAAEKL